MFRTAVQIDHRNAEAAQQLLKKTYRNVGWRTPELLSLPLMTSISIVSPGPAWTPGRAAA
jgi:hypothetical protein